MNFLSTTQHLAGGLIFVSFQLILKTCTIEGRFLDPISQGSINTSVVW